MATFLTDNFTDTDNTLITAHTPDSGGSWTLHTGTNGLIHGNEAHGNTSFGYLFHSQVAAADGESVTGVFVPLTSYTTVGLLLRCDSASGGSFYMAYWQPNSSGALSFWRKKNGTLTQIKTGASFTATGTHTIEFLVSGTGASVSLEVKIDGTSRDTFSDTDASRVTTLGSAGMVFADNGYSAGYRLTSITASDVSSSATIGITTPVDGRIVQRSGTAGTIGVTGVYTGTPTTIEARLVQDGTSTPLSGFDWATAVASPSGGTFSFNLSSVPEGGWYNVQVRHSNDTGVTATSNKVGVGALIGVVGQSNAYYWVRNFSTATSPNSLVRIHGNINTETWTAPATSTMAGAIGFGNALATTLGIPVGILDYAASGGSMSTYWIPVTQATNRAFTDSVTDIGGKLEAVCWIQGEGDADVPRSQAQYYGDLGTLFSDWRTQFSQASLPIVLVTIGRATSGLYTDAESQAIFDAQVQKCADSNIYRVDRKDLGLSDTVHHDAAGYETLGARCAQAVAFAVGEVTDYRGPSISMVRKVSGAVFDVTLTHDLGSDFTPTTGITGFTVFDGASPVTVSSAVRTAANKIRLTLASSPAALPVVKYLYGNTPTITGVVKDNSSLTLPLEGNSGVTAVNPITATITLVNTSGTPQASLTGLKWAWFDQVTPDAFVAPVDQGTAEVTDGSGDLVIDLPNTTKTTGQVGFLVVSDTDGTTTQSPAHKAFAGPVAVD